MPTTSGVYFFRNKRGQILYIGKAVNLKNRLASYFKSQSQLSGLTAKLMEKAERIDWQEIDSEIEALILESQLIKKYHPPFNIMLRDDKQYFFVGFTKEKFPRIFLTHQPSKKFTKNKKLFVNILKTENCPLSADFIGPFTDGSALKTTLRLLRRIFPYCTCKQEHNNYCLNYHIGKCLGFCCLKKVDSLQFTVYRKKYEENIKAVKETLEGKRVSLIKKLKKEMLGLGEKHKFEKAIELRGKIEKLEKVFENAQIIQNTKYKIQNTKNRQKYANPLVEFQGVLDLPYPPKRIEGYDISNIQGQFATGAMAVFTDGRPDRSQYRKFKIRLSDKPNDIAMLKEVLIRRFNHPEWPYPDLIVVDGGRAQLNAVRSAIFNFQFSILNNVSIIALTKNKRHRGNHIYLWSSQDHRLKEGVIPLKKLPERVRNLILQVDAEAHRFAINYYRKLHRRFENTPPHLEPKLPKQFGYLETRLRL